MTHVACESKLRSVVRSRASGRINAQGTEWHSGVRSCIKPGLPTYLVQELKAGTVLVKKSKGEIG